jgi:hypothetical protein
VVIASGRVSTVSRVSNTIIRIACGSVLAALVVTGCGESSGQHVLQAQTAPRVDSRGVDMPEVVVSASRVGPSNEERHADQEAVPSLR